MTAKRKPGGGEGRIKARARAMIRKWIKDPPSGWLEPRTARKKNTAIRAPTAKNLTRARRATPARKERF